MNMQHTLRKNRDVYETKMTLQDKQDEIIMSIKQEERKLQIMKENTIQRRKEEAEKENYIKNNKIENIQEACVEAQKNYRRKFTRAQTILEQVKQINKSEDESQAEELSMEIVEGVAKRKRQNNIEEEIIDKKKKEKLESNIVTYGKTRTKIEVLEISNLFDALLESEINTEGIFE